jgi:hypothetical protein
MAVKVTTNGKEKVEFHAGAEVLASLSIGNIRVVPDYHHRCVCVYVCITCVCLRVCMHTGMHAAVHACLHLYIE